MVITSQFSINRAKTIKKAAKQSLDQRICQMVGISDDSGSNSESSKGEAGLAGTAMGKLRLWKDTFLDGSTD